MFDRKRRGGEEVQTRFKGDERKYLHLTMKRLEGPILLGLLTLFGLGYGQGPQVTGQISGVVQGPDGAPVTGSLVVVTGHSGPGAVSFAGRAVTASDGTFQVTNVPAGTFTVCPYVLRNIDLLSPCLYDARPTITLTTGQSATMSTMRLAQGYRLKIHIDDSVGKYSHAIAAGKQVGLLVMVSVDGSLPLAAANVSTDLRGMDKEIVVPFDRDVKVLLGCHGVNVTDENGNAVPRSDIRYGGEQYHYTPIVYRVQRRMTAPIVRYTVVDVD